jgi:hypothetical protein
MRAQDIAVTAALLACACSSEDATQDPDAGSQHEAGSQQVAPHDAGDTSKTSGTFVLSLTAAVPASGEVAAKPAFTSLLGQVYAAPKPEATTWTMTAEADGCRLLEPSVPFCDPGCTGGDVCIEGGTCAAYPDPVDVGTVALSGLERSSGNGAVQSKPVPPKYAYQLPGNAALAYPPFAEGDVVKLEADGGKLAPFTIEAAGIAPLELEGEGAIPFEAGAPTALRWTPPASSADSRIVVRVDLSHHGGQKGEIVCEVDDDGSFDIPAELGAKLIDLGLAGYPSLQLERSTKGSTVAGGLRIDFAIASAVTRELDVPGLVSCDEDDAEQVCPDGQTCGTDKRCE